MLVKTKRELASKVLLWDKFSKGENSLFKKLNYNWWTIKI